MYSVVDLEEWYNEKDTVHILPLISSSIARLGSRVNGTYLQIGSLGYRELSNLDGISNKILLTNKKVPLTEQVVCQFNFLPILEDTVDILVLPHTLECEQHRKVLLESYRILKPGGLLMVTGFDVNVINFFVNKVRSKLRSQKSNSNLLHISSVNESLNELGFKVLKNSFYHKKCTGLWGRIKESRVFGTIFNTFLGDTYLVIAEKEISKLNLVKNTNRVRRDNTISVPGNAAWD